MIDRNNGKNNKMDATNVFSRFQSSSKERTRNKKTGNVSSMSMQLSNEKLFAGVNQQNSMLATGGKRMSKDVTQDFKPSLSPRIDNPIRDLENTDAYRNSSKEEQIRLMRSRTGSDTYNNLQSQKTPKNSNDANLDDLIASTLPETFNVNNVYKRKDENCNFCHKQLGFLKRARHNCYKCGACVCEKCSENKIQLSRKDTTKYRVCNMCFSITQNKPIIVFYKDLEMAKETRLKALTTRKLQYKEMILEDERDIRNLKREIEDQKKQAEEELENLASEIRLLKQEQLNNKESAKSLNQFLKTEEINILKKQQEVSELENQWQVLKMQLENLEIAISDVTLEVENFLFQCMKYEKSTTAFDLSTTSTQSEIRRITVKYEDERKKNALQNKIKQKQDKLQPRKDNIIFETSAEHELSQFGDSTYDEKNARFRFQSQKSNSGYK